MSFNKKRSKVVEDSDNDDSSNETFVVYGTELPDITSSGEQDKGKFQPVWKQEVCFLLLFFFIDQKSFFIHTDLFDF